MMPLADSIEPVFQRILIKREEPVKKIGSIILPNMSEMERLEGTILKSGPEAVEMGFKSGDRVMFGKYAGMRPWGSESDLYIINAEDVIAKLH